MNYGSRLMFTVVDQLLEAVVADKDLDAERIHSIANWLATGAADREPIKCAIALLGVCQDSDDRDLEVQRIGELRNCGHA